MHIYNLNSKIGSKIHAILFLNCKAKFAMPVLISCMFLAASCRQKHTFFSNVPAGKTGINFQNRINESDTFNILDYLYYYNGGGVAIGDINNDGLPDIYFTSNKESNKLYLNKGNFVFEDITEQAGVQGRGNWKTGVTMADVNNDGWLDIYVSEVGKYKSLTGKNELFINNGRKEGTKVSFTEKAAEYGLDAEGFNTQASFFDYDKDGDLDMFLVNHSVHSTETYTDTSERRRKSDVSGDKLFRCDQDSTGIKYHEVTEQAGIFSSAIGYGLNVIIGDFNNDNWDDIYVSNDFHENDYYYINKQNGTFAEMNQQAFGHESRFSMGSDAGDINNDGWLDLITLDMLPPDEKTLKSSVSDDLPDIYEFKKRKGYHHQNARNCLQLNVDGGKKFSDIGLFAGVAATDWSWSPLLADFDNDGINDLFVSNGILKRPNDLDFIKFVSSPTISRQLQENKSADRLSISKMPEGKLSNYIFRGGQNLKFTDETENWGLYEPSFSNGAAYADLDNDGDLDLIINNINAPASVYRNNSSELKKNHYLNIVLRSKGLNDFAFGSKVMLKTASGIQVNYITASRGFESSSSTVLHFGLGENEKADYLEILWPDGTQQAMKDVPGDQVLTIDKAIPAMTVSLTDSIKPAVSPLFRDVTDSIGINFAHHENYFFDFNKQFLIPHAVSALGPKLAVADINGDGLDDFYVCGAKGTMGKLFQQTAEGQFIETNKEEFAGNSIYEDVNAVFFDADGDHDNDLYVVSGGNESSGNDPALRDRLYINDGSGVFHKKELPVIFENKSVAVPADVDHDGDLDLFVGGRVVAGRYGDIPHSCLLINNGKGDFQIAEEERAPGLRSVGMVSDAVWTDINNDGWKDLVIVGEWMPVTIYLNNKGLLRNATLDFGLSHTNGLWTSINAIDMEGSGYEDLFIGNWGTNSKLQASFDYPLLLYSGDLDQNGEYDQLMSHAVNGKYFLFAGKEELEKSFPAIIKKKFLDYKSMAGLTTSDILGARLQGMKKASVEMLTSVRIRNRSGVLTPEALPLPVQWSPVFAFATGDFDKNGTADIITAGNFFGVTPFEGRYDAGYGTVLLNDRSSFTALFPLYSGLSLDGEIRDIKKISIRNKEFYLFARNNGNLSIYQNIK